jgi:hypothetical protein
MMTKEQYPEFSQVWIATASLYNAKPNDMAVAIAFRALQKYEVSDVKRAISAHVRNPDGGQFMPKPADLFRHLEGDKHSRPLAAWTLVEQTISRFGRYETIVFDDAITMRAIQDMGGWILICGMDVEEMPFRREEFTKRYRGFLNTGLDYHPNKLVGVIEAQNSKDFPESVPEPRLVGNTAKALEVYQGGNKKQPLALTLSEAMKQFGQNVVELPRRLNEN